MNWHRFFFRAQHNTLLRLGIELDKSLARVAAIDREANIKQETITRLGKEASALKFRVADLERLLDESFDRSMALSVVADEVLDFLRVHGGGSGNTVSIVEIFAHAWYAAEPSVEGE